MSMTQSVVGYVHDGDLFCKECAERIFGETLQQPETVGVTHYHQGNSGTITRRCFDCRRRVEGPTMAPLTSTELDHYNDLAHQSLWYFALPKKDGIRLIDEVRELRAENERLLTAATKLQSIVDQVAKELRAASIVGALTFEEFEAVLGDAWLGWLPENDPRETPEEQYAQFCKALSNYRTTGDPFGYTKPRAE